MSPTHSPKQTLWTSGPWKIDFGHPRGLPGGISAKNGGRPITRFNAFARPSTPEALANAHLIAAAPELYEALETVLVALDVSRKAFGAEPSDFPDFEAWETRARAALSKARPTQEGA